MKAFLALLAMTAVPGLAGTPRELRVGIAGHAFDHLGSIGKQAAAAAASGSTIIYATGFGGDGYLGLPRAAELAAKRKAVALLRQLAQSMIQVFRRPDSVCEVTRLRLRGLDADPVCRAKNLDDARPVRLSGCELVEVGVRAAIERHPGAATIVYRNPGRAGK